MTRIIQKIINAKDAYIIAAIPFIGYYFSYSFEKGYLSFFSIPEVYVKVNLESVLFMTITITSIFIVCYQTFMSAIQNLFSKPSKILWVRVLSNILISISISILLSLFVEFSLVTYLVFFMLILIVFFLLQEDLHERKIDGVRFIMYSVLLVYFISRFVEILGSYKAEQQSDYLLTRYNVKSYVIVKGNNEEKIAVLFDMKRNQFGNEVVLIPSGDVVNAKIIKIKNPHRYFE